MAQYKKALNAKATVEDVINLVNQATANHLRRHHSRFAWWQRLRDRLRRKPKA